MRKIPVQYLKPGMKIGRSVFTSGGIMLIRSGMILSKNAINRLKLTDIPSVYIDDGFISDIEVEDIISDETRNNAIKRVKNIFEDTKIQDKCGRKTMFIQEDEISKVVEEILEGILSRRDVLVSLTDIRSFDEYTYGHSVNVCALALLTGSALKLPYKTLLQLGVGAILHDIGKIIIPREILNKPGPLTDEEFDIMKTHSEDGYHLVKQKNIVSDISASIIYEHHERINGSGYPRSLVGEKMHICSKIVSLVDVYDALTVDRIYRKAYMPYEAYEMLAGSGDTLFDFDVVKAFLGNIAIYPIGSFLELNTGQVGIVVQVRKGLTHCPVVRVLFEEKTRVIDKPYEIDLAEHLNVVVTKLLEYEEVDKLVKRKQSHG